MARFEKGKPKTGGKTKGNPNKKTLILETFCEDIIEGGIERFNNAMNVLAGVKHIKCKKVIKTLPKYTIYTGKACEM